MRRAGLLWGLSLLLLAARPAPTTSGVPAMEQAEALRTALSQALGIRPTAGEAVKCGLPLITRALSARNSLSAQARSLLARLLQRTERQKQRTSGHFTVHYDTTGTSAAVLLGPDHLPSADPANAYADSVLSIANQVYDYEIGTLGYGPPPEDGIAGGGPEYDLYVEDLGPEYGETTPEIPLDNKPDGGQYITYITIDNDFSFVKPDSNIGLPALRVTLAHEFHHAIQLGQYGYWSSEVYFHELTSVWMETMVFPEITDYLNYLRAPWGEFQNPDEPFTSNQTIMYSRGIWGTYLSNRFTPVVMREIWEDIRQDAPLQANDVVLRRHGRSFRQEFAEWTLWNYFTERRADPVRYYPRGAVYPPVIAVGIDFKPPASQQTLGGTLHPLAARYYEIATGTDTSCLVVTSVNDGDALTPQPPQYTYSVALNRNSPGDGYLPIGTAGYYSLSVVDPTNWKTWAVQGRSVVASAAQEGIPYPNPFHADGSSVVSLPAHGTSAMLRVYDSAMRLVYEAVQNPTVLPDKTVFTWNGRRNDGRLAASGVYFFTLELPDQATVTGKLALLRNGP